MILVRVIFIYTIFMITIISTVKSQTLCNGNLGENIFEAGDFGAGTSNVLGFNPNIAPGFTYTTDVPPTDGFYTITNSIYPWNPLWASWLRTEDNSDDSNGYMMVVNASISPSIFFQQTITELCENTTYEFSADIINLILSGVANHGKPNVSFSLNNEIQFTSGDVPQNNTWNTYGFTFQTEPGQTELTLTLRNNAPGGIGNDLALDNISFRACGPSAFVNTDQEIFLCAEANEPAALTADIDLNNFFIQWQSSTDGGLTWNDISGETGQVYLHNNFLPGNYYYRYMSAGSLSSLSNAKCRIISDIIRIEVLPIFYQATDSICQGLVYPYGNEELETDGTYVGNFISNKGCDSIVTLDLTFVENDISFDLSINNPSCLGESSGTIEIQNVVNAANPSTYFFENEASNNNNKFFDELSPGVYDIKVVDRFQCVAEQSTELTIGNPFTMNVGQDINLKFGEVSDLVRIITSSSPASVTWTPADEFLMCTDCTQNRITGVDNKTYVITAQSEDGCTVTDSIKIIVDKEDLQIYIPNAFSPNGDGVNDHFQVYSYAQSIKNIPSVTIFNRWGAVMYEGNLRANTFNDGWDGRYKGKLVQNGVYLYLFKIELIDGRIIEKSGSITVMY